MNKNIEVINEKLWAVRFSYLDYIQEISIKPDPSIPLHEELGRIAPGGLMILNKDHPGFEILKGMFPKLMKKNQKQLDKELMNSLLFKTKTDYEALYYSMLRVEKERRIKERM